jgi:hypothetical protein
VGAKKAEKVSYLELVKVLNEWYETGGTGGKRRRKARLALYRCTFNGCGTLVKHRQTDVQTKHVRSCGCYHRFVSRNMALSGDSSRKNYTDTTVGRFRVFCLIGNKGGYSLWRAICLECQREIEITSKQIQDDCSPCYCRLQRAAILNGRRRRIKNMLSDIEFYTTHPLLKGASK